MMPDFSSLSSPNALPEALIFDLDDTLAATAELWKRAMQDLLAFLGRSWSEEIGVLCKGLNVPDLAVVIHDETQTPVAVGECQQRLRESLFRAFADGPLRPMPGAVECVRRLKESVPILAVASGSPAPLIESAISQLDLEGVFTHRISSESVARGKPDPDVFLAAAKACHIAPAGCLVFEDSLAGARAARAAGMPCFVVPSIPSPELSRTATRIFASLADITVGDIEGFPFAIAL